MPNEGDDSLTHPNPIYPKERESDDCRHVTTNEKHSMASKHKSKLLIGSIINASLRLEISRAQQQ
jgi:hypothetical protein